MSQYDSIEQKASYGIGRNMGDQLAQQAFAGLDIPALQQGLADALNGLEFAVSRDDINDAFQVITARMQEEQEAAAKAALDAATSTNNAATRIARSHRSMMCRYCRLAQRRATPSQTVRRRHRPAPNS